MSVEMFTELEGRDEAAYLSVRGFDVEVERDERRKFCFLVCRNAASESARQQFSADKDLQRFLAERRQLKSKTRCLP